MLQNLLLKLVLMTLKLEKLPLNIQIFNRISCPTQTPLLKYRIKT